MKKFIKTAVAFVATASFLATSAFAAQVSVGFKGDVNRDGKINSSDALAILEECVGVSKTELDKRFADVDADGLVNSADALRALQISVGLFDAEEIFEEQQESPKVPSSKDEIVDYYNAAVNKITSSKAGYLKVRTTELGKLEGAETIMKIDAARDAIYSFLGVGDTTYTNKKGESKYLLASALKNSDVKTATCENNNGIYTITLVLADGSSASPNFSDSSPLQRSGLYCGKGEKADYDYKSAENIYAGIKNVQGASVKSIKEKTTDSKIVVKVDSNSGNVTSLDISWKWIIELSDVKYSFIKVSGKGDVTSKVSVTNIKY